MKKPVTCGAHRILHDLFKNGAMFKHGLHSEKLRELEGRGYVAISANSLVYLTPTGQQSAIESFVGEGLLASEYYARATAPADNAGPYEAELCGNSIGQETLSAVLVHFLPTTNLDKASEHAVKLASAVKASFIELGCSTGGYVSDRNTAPLIFGERMSESVIPASTIKLNVDGEEKQVSTLTVRVEMDASSVQQSLDEVESAISKHLATVLDKALKPGGKIWSAIKNHR
ncbi:TPA: hypothetical protein L2B15_005232 [Klebsiella oxytoca]|nr:hypothetical protein [Klebsiella oxytoca]